LKISVIGENDPFVHVSLAQNEEVFAESGAMVMMDTTIDLVGQTRGGFFSAISRRLTSGESFFQQSFKAVRGNGDVLLSPALQGGVEILQVSPEKAYLLNDGAFVAAEAGVQITTTTQGLSRALLGGTGGFFIMQAKGQGQLAVTGLGTVFAIDVTAGNDIIVDNYHVVAWDAALKYSITESTAKRGLLRGLISSITSGEGLVNRFTGNGKVYICSRNRAGFLSWIASSMPQSSR
jgi:uncharacterized protein (TIGR00266 family)